MLKKQKVYVSWKASLLLPAKAMELIKNKFLNQSAKPTDPELSNNDTTYYSIFFFSTPEAAKEAIYANNYREIKSIGELTVSFKVSIHDFDDNILYASYIPEGTTRRQLYEHFGGDDIVKIDLYEKKKYEHGYYRMRRYAVIRFFSREKAEEAFSKFHFKGKNLFLELGEKREVPDFILADQQNKEKCLYYPIPKTVKLYNIEETLKNLCNNTALDFDYIRKILHEMAFSELSKKLSNRMEIVEHLLEFQKLSIEEKREILEKNDGMKSFLKKRHKDEQKKLRILSVWATPYYFS